MPSLRSPAVEPKPCRPAHSPMDSIAARARAWPPNCPKQNSCTAVLKHLPQINVYPGAQLALRLHEFTHLGSGRFAPLRRCHRRHEAGHRFAANGNLKSLPGLDLTQKVRQVGFGLIRTYGLRACGWAAWLGWHGKRFMDGDQGLENRLGE